MRKIILIKTVYLFFIFLYVPSISKAIIPGYLEKISPEKSCINFIAFGDWGWNGKYYQIAVAKEMGNVAQKYRINFIVSMGDNFQYSGIKNTKDPLWKINFEDIYVNPSLNINWYPVLGNHDYYGNPQAEIDYSKISSRWRMPARYYMVHKTGCDSITLDMFFLDTSPFQKKYYKNINYGVIGQDTAAQLRWLDSCLSVSKSRWKLVFGHHSIYTGGPHTSDLQNMPGRFEPIFSKYNVDAYFSGHDHDIEHIVSKRCNAQFFVCGSGGNPTPVSKIDGTRFAASSPGFLIIKLTKTKMEVSAIDVSGKTIYSVGIDKQ